MLFDYRISGDANGVEVASTVNQALYNPMLVIVSTGDTSKEVFEEIGRAGFIFMQKPVAPDSLKKVLENTLSNSSVK